MPCITVTYLISVSMTVRGYAPRHVTTFLSQHFFLVIDTTSVTNCYNVRWRLERIRGRIEKYQLPYPLLAGSEGVWTEK